MLTASPFTLSVQLSTGARRVIYGLAAIAIVSCGLIWRSGWLALSPFLVKYGGDAWWAALIYGLVRFCGPSSPALRSAVLALAISFAVEFSQLHHAPWLDAVRKTKLGVLALGNTFNWPDLPAYAVGILVAALADRTTLSRSIPRWKRPAS